MYSFLHPEELSFFSRPFNDKTACGSVFFRNIRNASLSIAPDLSNCRLNVVSSCSRYRGYLTPSAERGKIFEIPLRYLSESSSRSWVYIFGELTYTRYKFFSLYSARQIFSQIPRTLYFCSVKNRKVILFEYLVQELFTSSYVVGMRSSKRGAKRFKLDCRRICTRTRSNAPRIE